MNILFIDFETNGLTKTWGLTPSRSNYRNWPEIITASWRLVNIQGNDPITFNSKDCMLKRDDIRVHDWNEVSEKEYHGVSRRMSLQHGFNRVEIFKMLISDIDQSDLIIAHNIDFDVPVFQADLYRAGLNINIMDMPTFCTMKSSTDLLQLPPKNEKKLQQYGVQISKPSYKWPSLQELHTFFFGAEFDKAHTSSADVEACMKCYFKLVQALKDQEMWNQAMDAKYEYEEGIRKANEEFIKSLGYPGIEEDIKILTADCQEIGTMKYAVNGIPSDAFNMDETYDLFENVKCTQYPEGDSGDNFRGTFYCTLGNGKVIEIPWSIY